MNTKTKFDIGDKVWVVFQNGYEWAVSTEALKIVYQNSEGYVIQWGEIGYATSIEPEGFLFHTGEQAQLECDKRNKENNG